MGQSAKALLQLAVLVGAIGTLSAWIASDHPDAIVWGLRLGFPAMAIAAVLPLLHAMRRKEILPDLLAQVVSPYFERDGLCFSPVIDVAGDVARLSIYFQNRYSGSCRAQIAVRPPVKTLSLFRHALPDVRLEIVCGGGEFGVVHLPYPIPARYQGKRMQLEIGAHTRYPNGRGRQLRFREGMRCGGTGTGTRSWMSLLLLPLGVLYLSSPARCTLQLPRNVAESITAETTAMTEILWCPDLPTGGFPVTIAGADAAGPVQERNG